METARPILLCSPQFSSDSSPRIPETRSDLELLTAWREGGEDLAARHLFARHFAAIHRFFRNKVHDPSDARDLASDTFARLFHRRAQYPEMYNVRAYAFGIAKRVLLGYLRQKHRRVEQDLLAGALIELIPRTPSSVVFACHRLHILVQALRTLPLHDQILLEAKYFEDLSEPELAEVLGIEVTTLPGRHRRARNRLIPAVEHLLTTHGELKRATEVSVLLDTWISELRREMRRGDNGERS